MKCDAIVPSGLAVVGSRLRSSRHHYGKNEIKSKCMTPNYFAAHSKVSKAGHELWVIKPVGSTPEEFRNLVEKEIARWTPNMRKAGLKAD